jgi:hypothetical protein
LRQKGNAIGRPLSQQHRTGGNIDRIGDGAEVGPRRPV